MIEVVIVSALRTPIGNFGGALKDVSAVELGTAVVKASLEKLNLDPREVNEVIMGNILSAGLGQNIARQVAMHAGIPKEVGSFTINKLCGSGLKAVMLAAQSIMVGENEVVIAGGTESMSQAPYILSNQRWGSRMGDAKAVDLLLRDGLTDAFGGFHMGVTAENIAEQYGFTREMQDELATVSQNRAEVAIKAGKFNEEIIPVTVKTRKGDIVVSEDEFPRFGTTIESLGKLRPAFKKDGSVTAGNASGMNDGAAAIVLMSKEKAEKLGLKPLATIKSFASAGVAPEIMGTGPIPSTRKALEKANFTVEDLDLVEANEAFAAQALSVITDLKLDREIVNVNGGAIALGHPIGASGARILVTLLHEMEKRDAKTGLATLCIGGGQGASLIVAR